MSLFRRMLLPAILAVPIWTWAWILIVRPTTFAWEIPDPESWLSGAFFGCMGILIFCLPLGQRAQIWNVHQATKILIFTAAGAAGGFGIVAAIGLVASWFALNGLSLGIFGLLPGAITAALWAAMNLDLLKEPSIA